MDNPNVSEGKTIAIISYITLIGLIIAIVMNKEKKNNFAAFHIRQSLGIMILYLIVYLIFWAIYVPFLPTILYLLILVLWILGFMAAIQGEIKPVPLIGDYFQQWFKSI